MNSPKKNVSNTSSINVTSKSSLTLKNTEKIDSRRKPIIRKTSKDNINSQNVLKRRTYSLKDKEINNNSNCSMLENDFEEKSLDSTEYNDINKPEKDSSDNIKKANMTTNIMDVPHVTEQYGDEHFENMKSSTYAIPDEKMDLDDHMEDHEEPTIIEVMPRTEKEFSGRKSGTKVNPKKDSSLSIKNEKTKIEKKILDPKAVNEEIRRNYESEISVLKKQLLQAGQQPNQSEDTLLNRCNMLESQLRRSQNEAESLSEQVTGLRSQLQTWPNRVRELEDENETLRGRVEDVRVINQQRQNQIDELHEIVKNLESKLWEQSSGSNHQEKVFLQRLMSEYDHLLKDYDLVKLNNMTNERKIYEARSRISDLTTKLSEFEINFRKLESENSFLKRRLCTEKSQAPHNFRGWDRNVYPPQFNRFDQEYQCKNGSQEMMRSQPSPKPSFESGMMSMSCYGALPSYEDNDDHNDNTSTLRRFEFNKSRGNERFSPNDMNQSVYVQSKKERNNVATPTNDRRRVAIMDKVQYGNNPLKESSSSFESLHDDTIDVMSQSIARNGNDKSNVQPVNRRRQKPELYHRDSWVESKTEEEKELERCYDQLQSEKKLLLTNLSHIPTNCTARNRRTNREQRESLEAQLDHIDRKLGLMRMTLKQKNML